MDANIAASERDAGRRADAAGDRRSRGLGLGWAISREIVALHGGTIRAGFPPEGGSRFTVRLPAGPASQSG